MSKTNFKFKTITVPSKDMKLLEKAISVDYKGKRNNYVNTLPILSTKVHASKFLTPTEFIKSFDELCEEEFSNVCMKISLRNLIELKQSGVLRVNTHKEHADDVQRNIVKGKEWISNLITDMLIGYQAIPSITLSSVKENGETFFFATDGQQRIFAIIALLNNEFALAGTNTCLDGCYFNDLPLEVKEILYNRTLLAQISKPEFADFRKYSFIKLNTSSTTLNSIEMANAMHSSEFSKTLQTLVKRDMTVANMVTTIPHKHGKLPDLLKNPSALPNNIKDRQTEYDRLLFAYANAHTKLGEVTSAKRAKRALQMRFLEIQSKKKIDAKRICQEIHRVSELMYCLFGQESSREYIGFTNRDGVYEYEKTANGTFLHSSKISNMQYNSLYLISHFLYENGVRPQKIKVSVKKASTEIINDYFTNSRYVCMKGWNNNNHVYESNIAVAEQILKVIVGEN